MAFLMQAGAQIQAYGREQKDIRKNAPKKMTAEQSLNFIQKKFGEKGGYNQDAIETPPKNGRFSGFRAEVVDATAALLKARLSPEQCERLYNVLHRMEWDFAIGLQHAEKGKEGFVSVKYPESVVTPYAMLAKALFANATGEQKDRWARFFARSADFNVSGLALQYMESRLNGMKSFKSGAVTIDNRELERLVQSRIAPAPEEKSSAGFAKTPRKK